MGNVLFTAKLSDFLKEKLTHEFDTFYDVNRDGVITCDDFAAAKEKACKLNNWSSECEQAQLCAQLYAEIWEALKAIGDKDNDGEITLQEWLALWENLYKETYKKLRDKAILPTVEQLPMWAYRYLKHRFQLFDRTGDGVIDIDEYEYVMESFGISPKDSRKAFRLFTESKDDARIDFDQFTTLAAQYYFSNDLSSYGNFLNGKVIFESDAELPKKKGIF